MVPLFDHTVVAKAIAAAGCRSDMLVDEATFAGDASSHKGGSGKTIAFQASASVVVCCVRADQKIDDVKLSHAVGVRCRLLGARRCEELLG